jgi:ribokinase
MAGHVGEDGAWLREGLVAHGVGVDYLLTDPAVRLSLPQLDVHCSLL